MDRFKLIYNGNMVFNTITNNMENAMTTEEFKSLFDKEIMPAISNMREAGQKEYAQDIDEIFANFHRIANDMSIDRKQVLMVYMLKHIDGINAFIKGHESQREDVTGRITDCIVYLMLLWGMIKEEREESNNG